MDNGSLSNFIEEICGGGEEKMLSEVGMQFHHVGPTTAIMFLKSIGENLPKTTAKVRSTM